jgi:hypothetical protein
MAESRKANVCRLLKVLLTIGIISGIILAAGVYYWPAVKPGIAGRVQQLVRIQERLAAVNQALYRNIYTRISDPQWARQVIDEQNWLLKNWLIFGVGIGVLLPVIAFLAGYAGRWWRQLIPPSLIKQPDKGWEIIQLIQRKVMQVHWRANRFNLEQALINVLVLGLSCFSLQLLIHSCIFPSRFLVRTVLGIFLVFSYTCFFFYMYVKRCSLRQAAILLDDKLHLKQELVTSLDVQAAKNSRLGRFLLADTAAKIEHKSISQLFPDNSYHLRPRNFFLQLGIILLTTAAITLGGPKLVSSYYTERSVNPLSDEMGRIISQQTRQIKELSSELRQQPSDQLQEVADELDQLIQKLLILGSQNWTLDIGDANGVGNPGVGNPGVGNPGVGNPGVGNLQGTLMPQGGLPAVSAFKGNLSAIADVGQFIADDPGTEASPSLMVSPQEMKDLMASFSSPSVSPEQAVEPSFIPRNEFGKEQAEEELNRISERLDQLAQQLTESAPENGTASQMDNSNGGMQAGEVDADESLLKAIADRLDQLADYLQKAQLPSSAKEIKYNLWFKGKRLEELSRELSRLEAAENNAQKSSAKDKTKKPAEKKSAVNSGKQKLRLRRMAAELSRSARQLGELGAGLGRQGRVQLVPYSGQYGVGEASIISGEKSQPLSAELSSRPKLRISGESAPHYHSQVTNISLNNSQWKTPPEQEQFRKAIIARGYNQGASPHPAQVKLGQGKRDQPAEGKQQHTPMLRGLLSNSQQSAYLQKDAALGKGSSPRGKQRLNPDRLNLDQVYRGNMQTGNNKRLAEAAEQYNAWEQWGRDLQQASLRLSDLAHKRDSAAGRQRQAESVLLNRLGNQLGRLSAQLNQQAERQGDEEQGLNRLQGQMLNQLSEQLGSVSQRLLGLAHGQSSAQAADFQQRQSARKDKQGDQLLRDEYKGEGLKNCPGIWG